MLALTFQIGAERLALDIRHVREVVPRVQLRPLSGAPSWLAGVFVYRGDVVPVVDLHRLAGAECPPHLSSRIILVPAPGRGDGGEGKNAAERLIGLLVTQVDVTRDLKAEGQAVPSMRDSDQADFGSAYAAGQDVFRLLDPERFLPESAWRQLLSLPKEAGA